MKISFDFDSTLSRKGVQKLAKQLIARGDEIHIVTSRYEDTSRWKTNLAWAQTFNKDLFRVTDHLKIKRENIHFMNMMSKEKFFLENPGFTLHLDDDIMEIIPINIKTDVVGILCDFQNVWIEKFKEITKL